MASTSHRRLSPLQRWWRRQPQQPRHSQPAPVTPAPRRPGIEVVDARTEVAHQVSPEALLAGRQRGVYWAACDTEVLAASLTAPSRSGCLQCARRTL